MWRSLLSIPRTIIAPAFRVPLSGLEQRGVDIGRVLESKGIGCHLNLEEVVETPRLVSYPFKPHAPHLVDWRSLGNHADVIEGVLAVAGVRVYREAGLIWVETPAVTVRSVTCWDHAPPAPMYIPVGVTGRGAISRVRISPDHVPHLALIGPTQAGKTTAAFNMAFQLIRSTQADPDALRMFALVSDPKGWQELMGVRQWWGVALHDEAPQVLGWLRQLVKRREAAQTTRPAIVVFVDDYPAILEEYPALAKSVDGLLNQARRAGVHLVVNTQDPTREGSGKIGTLILDRMVFGQASASAASGSTGRSRSGAERLTGKGDMLVVSPTLPEPVRVAGLLATPADLARLPSGNWESPPWLDWSKSAAISPISAISPNISAISTSQAQNPPAPAEIEPIQPAPAPLTTALTGLTDRQQVIVHLVRDKKAPHEIAKQLTGQKGGPTYQACVQEVKELVAHLLT